MRRAILIAVLAAAVAVPVALAAQGDPQKKHTKADMARARAVSLRLADFGAGWKQGPPSKKDESNPRCSTYNPDQSDLIETGTYDSPDFSRADGTSVSSSTGVFKTATMAKTGYARVVVPQLPHCFAEIFKKGFVKPDSATIFFAGPLGFASYGDRTNAYRIKASVTAQGAKFPVVVDVVLFNRGRLDVAVIFVGIAQPLPAALEKSIVAKVAARAK
jgi:hypothetical protein